MFCDMSPGAHTVQSSSVSNPLSDDARIVMPLDLLRYSDGSRRPWAVTVDGVMGGKSSGSVSYPGTGLRFEGYLNTDGGGFTYMHHRSRPPLDLSQYAGIRLTFATVDAASVGNAP